MTVLKNLVPQPFFENASTAFKSNLGIEAGEGQGGYMYLKTTALQTFEYKVSKNQTVHVRFQLYDEGTMAATFNLKAIFRRNSLETATTTTNVMNKPAAPTAWTNYESAFSAPFDGKVCIKFDTCVARLTGLFIGISNPLECYKIIDLASGSKFIPAATTGVKVTLTGDLTQLYSLSIDMTEGRPPDCGDKLDVYKGDSDLTKGNLLGTVYLNAVAGIDFNGFERDNVINALNLWVVPNFTLTTNIQICPKYLSWSNSEV